LIKNLEIQAAPFSPQYVLGEQVVGIEKLATDEWRLTTNKGTRIHAKAILIAAGCGAFGPNRPPLAGIEAYEGSAVHYMVGRREAFTDAEIVIAGGGDSAVDWAVSLAALAKKIYVVHRRDKFRAAPEMVDKMQALAASGKVELVVPYQLEALEGDAAQKTLSAVIVKSMDGQTRRLEAQHLLAFFGLSMELGPIAEWGLNLDRQHITVDRGTMQTSIPGIFAIGDIATYEHKLKLILCGFAEAAHAAHAIREIVYPGVAYHFEYSTTKGVPA
jgi:thioredoxin reductase (NADPH)